MTTDSIGRVLTLPSAGAASFGRAAQPLGAGWAQVATSNGLHMAREGGLRTLVEHEGTPSTSTAWAELSGGSADPEAFQWDTAEASGAFVLCAGLHLLRRHGDRVAWPRVEARWRWKAHRAGDTAGAVLIVTPGIVRPSLRDHLGASTTTTSNTFTDGALTVAVTDERQLQHRALDPTRAPDERGDVFVFSAFLGFWNTSNQAAYPTHVRGVSIFLREP